MTTDLMMRVLRVVNIGLATAAIWLLISVGTHNLLFGSEFWARLGRERSLLRFVGIGALVVGVILLVCVLLLRTAPTTMGEGFVHRAVLLRLVGLLFGLGGLVVWVLSLFLIRGGWPAEWRGWITLLIPIVAFLILLTTLLIAGLSVLFGRHV